MTLVGATASLFLKRASSTSRGIFSLAVNPNFYAGGFLYVISALANIWILRFLDYSVVLPLTSFTYVWTMILSHFVLKEKISRKKIFGVIFIVAGALCVSI
jgi:drug/metabolite transporter (DMT)-like permease